MTLYANGIQRVELFKIHKTVALRPCCYCSSCSWFLRFENFFILFSKLFNLAVTLLFVKVVSVVVVVI